MSKATLVSATAVEPATVVPDARSTWSFPVEATLEKLWLLVRSRSDESGPDGGEAGGGGGGGAGGTGVPPGGDTGGEVGGEGGGATGGSPEPPVDGGLITAGGVLPPPPPPPAQALRPDA